MEEKIVTVDELWVELKKSIDAGWGHKLSFKTKIGMMRHVKKMIKNRHAGKAINFIFDTGKGYLPCKLMIKKEWIKNGRK